MQAKINIEITITQMGDHLYDGIEYLAQFNKHLDKIAEFIPQNWLGPAPTIYVAMTGCILSNKKNSTDATN